MTTLVLLSCSNLPFFFFFKQLPNTTAASLKVREQSKQMEEKATVCDSSSVSYLKNYYKCRLWGDISKLLHVAIYDWLNERVINMHITLIHKQLGSLNMPRLGSYLSFSVNRKQTIKPGVFLPRLTWHQYIYLSLHCSYQPLHLFPKCIFFLWFILYPEVHSCNKCKSVCISGRVITE